MHCIEIIFREFQKHLGYIFAVTAARRLDNVLKFDLKRVLLGGRHKLHSRGLPKQQTVRSKLTGPGLSLSLWGL